MRQTEIDEFLSELFAPTKPRCRYNLNQLRSIFDALLTDDFPNLTLAQRYALRGTVPEFYEAARKDAVAKTNKSPG
ncbi:MAG: hypothetical protein ACI9VM_000942 [Candidatus Azotimanducaceae bacterium]|jgi:hypothetical protein